jgi:hypothetical protein
MCFEFSLIHFQWQAVRSVHLNVHSPNCKEWKTKSESARDSGVEGLLSPGWIDFGEKKCTTITCLTPHHLVASGFQSYWTSKSRIVEYCTPIVQIWNYASQKCFWDEYNCSAALSESIECVDWFDNGSSTFTGAGNYAMNVCNTLALFNDRNWMTESGYRWVSSSHQIPATDLEIVHIDQL